MSDGWKTLLRLVWSVVELVALLTALWLILAGAILGLAAQRWSEGTFLLVLGFAGGSSIATRSRPKK